MWHASAFRNKILDIFMKLDPLTIRRCSPCSEDAFLPSPFCIEYFALKNLATHHYGCHKKQIKRTI